MKAVAPGKLLLTGAYSVLEGSVAIVLAVDRYAVADGALCEPASRELQAATETALGPAVDVSALYERGTKLGLGSSAAGLVAALAALERMRGADVCSALIRQKLFDTARRGHFQAQSGGSGVDVAASVWGGVLSYTNASGKVGCRSLSWSGDLYVDAVWTGRSARTSQLLEAVVAFSRKNPRAHACRMAELAAASFAAERALDSGDARALLEACRNTGRALSALSRDAACGIVPDDVSSLAQFSDREGGAFYPSGAGGGDVAVYVAPQPPSPEFVRELGKRGMKQLGLAISPEGVRPQAVANGVVQ